MSSNARKFKKVRGRRLHGTFSAWPHACADSPHFLALSASAKALLFHFLGQYRGFNNGDLSCNWRKLRACGWRSRTTIEKARRELEEKGWIVRTFQGSLHNRCNLYAITWQPIDECKGKLQVSAAGTALGFWKDGTNPWLQRDQGIRPKPRSNTPSGKSLGQFEDNKSATGTTGIHGPP